MLAAKDSKCVYKRWYERKPASFLFERGLKVDLLEKLYNNFFVVFVTSFQSIYESILISLINDDTHFLRVNVSVGLRSLYYT